LSPTALCYCFIPIWVSSQTTNKKSDITACRIHQAPNILIIDTQIVRSSRCQTSPCSHDFHCSVQAHSLEWKNSPIAMRVAHTCGRDCEDSAVREANLLQHVAGLRWRCKSGLPYAMQIAKRIQGQSPSHRSRQVGFYRFLSCCVHHWQSVAPDGIGEKVPHVFPRRQGRPSTRQRHQMSRAEVYSESSGVDPLPATLRDLHRHEKASGFWQSRHELHRRVRYRPKRAHGRCRRCVRGMATEGCQELVEKGKRKGYVEKVQDGEVDTDGTISISLSGYVWRTHMFVRST
jgi:hypothetical protein